MLVDMGDGQEAEVGMGMGEGGEGDVELLQLPG